MFATRRALVSLLVLSMLAGARLHAQATSPLTVSITPDSLALEPMRPASVVVVVRNTSTKSVRDVRLSWFSNSRIDVSGDTAAATTLAAGGVLVARLTIVGKEQSERNGSVIARVDYTRDAPAGRDVAFNSVTIRPASVLAAEEMLDVQVNASLATLTERQDGQLFLVLKNKADVPVIVDSLIITLPPRLAASSTMSRTIAPKSVATIPVTISKSGRVRAGKHQVVLDIPVRLATEKEARHIVLAREVEVGILGESAMLAVLGVPSFLVLPGFLMVLTFATLWKWRLFRPSTSSANITLSAKEPEFWLLAITLSGVLALAYPRLGGNDYLDAYDVGDVAKIWLLSTFVLGLGGYLVMIAALRVRHHHLMPRTTDSEVIILEKLAKQGLDLHAPRVKVASKLDALALEPQRADGGRIWVGPRIRWEWKGASSPDGKVDPLREALNKLMDAGDLKAIAAALRARVEDKNVTLTFEALDKGGIALPQAVAIKDVTWEGSTEQIVAKA